MCCIMGYSGKDIGLERLLAGFQSAQSRGPDMSRVLEIRTGTLLFHRLAIMGLDERGMQPFISGKSAVICNGELYGFRALKRDLEEKGYLFQSGSDCELLLPLYQEYGLGMFEKLDAEFALLLYDGDNRRMIAARDPIGIRPLYYGRSFSGKMLFASEPKMLVGLTDRIEPFPPGHYWDGEKLVRYHDPTAVAAVCHDGVEAICGNIHEKLVNAIAKRLDADAPMGFLLSGGLDSSLVCAVATKLLGRSIRTFAIGMTEDAIDLKYAKEVADHIGSEHTEIYMTPEEVISTLPEVIRTLGTWDITTIRASMGMYLLCKAIHERTNVKVLLTGEISDELFGYKYTDFAPSPEEFQSEAAKRIRELHMYDVLRADRCISANSMEARVPFGDLDFVKYVMSVDPAKKMNVYGKGKYLLRHAFEGDYLPHSILYREKAAFSDAVGHSMVDYLKAYAEARYTDDEFEAKAARYSHGRPFTKESLLYREIFEQYYPGQGDMIDDFWMPNKTWPGCNVNDPSARVLSNYGASGT